MLDLFQKVVALDDEINAACDVSDFALADELLEQQNAIVEEIEANGWRSQFDQFITEMN